MEENNKMKEYNWGFKESMHFEGIITTFRIEITKIRNLKKTCKMCVSLKKEVIDLHKTLGKFTKEKENMTWSYQVRRIP